MVGNATLPFDFYVPVTFHDTVNLAGGISGNGLSISTRTAAELRAQACSSYCVRYNIDDDDLYTATGTAVGQFRNTRTGYGP